jgi:hypothetical protein
MKKCDQQARAGHFAVKLLCQGNDDGRTQMVSSVRKKCRNKDLLEVVTMIQIIFAVGG